MKTLCLTLLLLSVFCCCDATPKGLELGTAPGSCCFNFSTNPIPLNRVSSITKTHSSCLNQAFIVQTVRGRQFCFRESSQWALKVYNNKKNSEGSRQ